MRYLVGLGVAAIAIALGAWAWISSSHAAPTPGETPAQVAAIEPAIADLLQTPFVAPGGAALDVDGMAALLPEKWQMTYDATNFDAATGATTLTDLTLTHADLKGATFTVDKVSTWGFDADLLQARLAGEQLDATAVLAQRIDFSGLSVTGLSKAYQPLIDAVTEGMDVNDVSGVDVSTTIDAYDFKVERVVIDTATLHPWGWSPLTSQQLSQFDKTPSIDELKGLHVMQMLASLARSYSVETIVFENMTSEMKMTQMGAQTDTSFNIAGGVYRDIDRGDVASVIMQDMTFSGTTMMPDMAGLADDDAENFDPGSMMKAIPISGGAKRYSIENVRTSNLLDHLTRGEWPDASETDLLSLGVLTAEQLTYALDGKPFYSVGFARYDLSGFHGLAPNQIELKLDDVVYHIDSFMDVMGSDLADLSESPEGFAVVNDVMNVLAKYDLVAPSFDMQMTWKWDQDKGVADALLAYGLDGMTEVSSSISMQTPTYAEMQPHLKFTDGSPVDGDALEDLFEQKFAVRSAGFVAQDYGGFDKMYSLIPEIAGVIPDASSEVKMLAAYEPDSLRQMAVGGVQMAGGEVVKEVPQLRPLFDGMANFMQDGGRLEIRMDPPQPLTSTRIEELDEADLEPENMLDALGLSVEHTTP